MGRPLEKIDNFPIAKLNSYGEPKRGHDPLPPPPPLFHCLCSNNGCLIFVYFSAARSPLYSHISVTIQGLSTIRSYKEQDKFDDKLHHYLNEHTKAWYLYIAINRWFGMRIDMISTLFLTFVVMTAIPLADSE